jgi:small ligand-binding sensory domain FIST
VKTQTIRVGSGLSTEPDARRAAEQACAQAREPLHGEPCDLAFVFVSPHHTTTLAEVVATTLNALRPAALLGCVGIWIVGGTREIEDAPAVSVWAGHLPGAELDPFALEYGRTPDGETFLGWPDDVPDGATAIVIADPFTFPADDWLRALGDTHPEVLVIGGLASGARAPGETRLVIDREVRNGGAAGVLVSGGVEVRALVSQGCKPVGMPYAVTAAEGQVISELGGKPPLERIRETYAASDEIDRKAMQLGLHVGRVVDEYKTEFRRGDFLVRNLLGADEQSGAVAVGDRVGLGETIQFHVRDAASADEDLRQLIATADRPAGALLFTCNGRGSRLFGVPDHDASVVAGALGSPLAGFFCAGELGPVGGRNFLHGFTASLALFYQKS